MGKSLSPEIEGFENAPEIEIVFKHKTKRNPSERLKVQVLMRDGNICRLALRTLSNEYAIE